MLTRILPMLILPALCGAALGAERINHEGRILGTQPGVSSATLFNTAAADAVVSSMQIMPRDSAWNEDVSALPVSGISGSMIATIKADVAVANRQRVVVFKEMNYALVPDNQPKIDIAFYNYADESDDLDPAHPTWGLWPVPSIMPVESWPAGQPGLTNAQWQQDINHDGGDRHAIVVMPGVGAFWETWLTQYTTLTPAWQASNGAKFSLIANTARPAGWTSGDAAGLPMFPALVRYDEAERGMVEHAMRIVVKRSQQSYIYPASHQAGSTTLASVPAMGQRLRLKAGWSIPSSWTKEERAIALGLKKYGAIVADNGSFFSISITPDDRWPSGCFDHLSTGAPVGFCDIDNFEVVTATGAAGGPRSSGALTADAGADQTVTQGAGASLAGTFTGSSPTPTWYVYPYATPPGTVTFGAASNTATTSTTTASFGAPGTYTLMLKVSDGVHTPAYDAVIITVVAGGGTTTSGTGTATGSATGSTTGSSAGTATGATSGTTGSTAGTSTTGTGTATTSSGTGTSSGGTTSGSASGGTTTGGGPQTRCGFGGAAALCLLLAGLVQRRRPRRR